MMSTEGGNEEPGRPFSVQDFLDIATGNTAKANEAFKNGDNVLGVFYARTARLALGAAILAIIELEVGLGG